MLTRFCGKTVTFAVQPRLGVVWVGVKACVVVIGEIGGLPCIPLLLFEVALSAVIVDFEQTFVVLIFVLAFVVPIDF